MSILWIVDFLMVLLSLCCICVIEVGNKFIMVLMFLLVYVGIFFGFLILEYCICFELFIMFLFFLL